MNKLAKTYQLINDYLNESLNEREKIAVEKRLKEDVNFRDYFEVQQKANRIIILNEENRIKNRLATIHKRTVLRDKAIKFSLIAVVIGLAIIAIVFLNEGNKVEKLLVDKRVELESSQIKEDKFSPLLIEEDNIKKPNVILVKETKERLSKIEESSSVIKVDLDSTKKVEKSLNIKEVDSLVDYINRADNPEVSLEKEIRFLNEDKTSVHDCSIYEAEIVLETFSTCSSQSKGVLNIKANKESYSYSMNGGFSIQKEHSFSKLKPGNYSLIVFDEFMCKSEPIAFKIESVMCDFIIQPNRSIYWEINMLGFNDDNVKLEIYNAKSGQKVFENNLSLLEENSWNGTAQSGELLPMGSYVYIMSSLNKNRTGNITIVQ
jgi:hypothetical protein